MELAAEPSLQTFTKTEGILTMPLSIDFHCRNCIGGQYIIIITIDLNLPSTIEQITTQIRLMFTDQKEKYYFNRILGQYMVGDHELKECDLGIKWMEFPGLPFTWLRSDGEVRDGLKALDWSGGKGFFFAQCGLKREGCGGDGSEMGEGDKYEDRYDEEVQQRKKGFFRPGLRVVRRYTGELFDGFRGS